jgi:hypothetical protein
MYNNSLHKAMKQFPDIPAQEAALVHSLDKPGQINISVFFVTQNDSKYCGVKPT